jgi:hypothetical protein
MTLPLFLDLAISLIFIYLILSLLTSEIQELLTTLMQWRAVHLKRSIEILLTGRIQDTSFNRYFANALYQNPVIRSLNYEAKGFIDDLFRKVGQVFISILQAISRSNNVFGAEKTGPSYIPPQQFAIALLDKLQLDELTQKYSELILREFNETRLELLDDLLLALRSSVGDDSLLKYESNQLKQSLNEITADFIQQRSTIANSFRQSVQQFIQFIDNTAAILSDHHHCKEIIKSRLPFLRQAILNHRFEPTIQEIISLLTDSDNYSKLHPELLSIILKALSSEPLTAQRSGATSQLLAKLRQDGAYLPPQLSDNLKLLANQAQSNADSLEAGLHNLKAEVEGWFDNAMDRASGVYRRNAKGVAILLGIVVAIASNADTIHMVTRLSKDSILRSAISTNASQLVTQTGQDDVLDDRQKLAEIQAAIDENLDDLPLPIGWGKTNRLQQAQESRQWAFPLLRRWVGWLISGIAISMGASFWYDLLKRVVQIRNTGNPPSPSNTSK